MGTIADKLTYTLEAKQDIKAAIEDKGVDVAIDASLKEYAEFIQAIQDGGGGGGDNKLFLFLTAPLRDGSTICLLETDTLLNKAMTNKDVVILVNGERTTDYSVVVLTDMSLKVTLNNALHANDSISITLSTKCYKNSNGYSNEIFIRLHELTFDDIVLDTYDCVAIRSEKWADTATDTYTFSSCWPTIMDGDIHAITSNGDSAITVGNQTISVNGRDNSVYNVHVQEGVIDDLGFIRWRWEGCAPYKQDINNLFAFEVFLFANGDASIYLHNTVSTWSGTFKFLGNTFTLKEPGWVSFYRRDRRYKFDAVAGLYNIDLHTNYFDIPTVRSITDLLDNITDMCILSNSKYDDSTVTVLMEPMAWSYNSNNIATVYCSGNSWIGLGSSSTEHIKLNRRDAALYRTYYAKYKIVTDTDIYYCQKIRWDGYSAYSSVSDSYSLIWELFLFSTGDAMIHLCKKPTSSWTGSFDFLGTPYDLISSNVVSFYRENIAGTSWNVDYNLYDPSKSNNLFNS